MGGIDWEMEDWNSSHGNLYLPDFHLKTAIRGDKRRFFSYRILDNKNCCPKYLTASIDGFVDLGLHTGNTSINGESLYPYLWNLNNIIDLQTKANLLTKFSNSLSVSKILTLPIIKALFRFHNHEATSSFLLLNDYTPSETIKKLVILKTYFNDLKYHMASNLKEKNKKIYQKYLSSGDLLSCYYNDHFCSFLIEGTYFIYDYDQILLISDVISSRYLTLLILELYSLTLPNLLPTVNMMLSVYQWGDDVVSKFGNLSYNCLKQFEAICTAVCLNKFDDLQASKLFYSGLKEEYSSEDWSEDITNLYDILERICDHPVQIMEIFGVYRHFGHPTVDEVLGCEQMKEHTRATVDIDDLTMRKVSGAFKLSFIRSFISKRNRWPQVNLDQITNKTLYKVAHNHITAFDDYTSNLSLEDWHTIQFKKEFDFDYYYDFTELLKDTSISPYYQNWMSIFDSSILENAPTQITTSSRRVLIEILKRKEINIQKICEVIMKDEVPQKWKIIALHAKERELSIQSRLFAMLVLEMRLYFGVTESNIKQVFKFVSGQTMTMGEGELQHHLLQVSDLEKNSSVVPITISIDYKKWNNYQRKENNYYIFQSLEQLFDTPNLFNYTHDFFSQCSYVLSSRDHPPTYLLKRSIMKDWHKTFYEESIEPLSDSSYRKLLMGGITETETTWVGQQGGCEGQRQKGWTLTTNSMLKAIEFEIGIKSTITGQGDNQVIVIYLPIRIPGVSKSEYVREYQHVINSDINNYIKYLEDYSVKTGIKIKPQESWISSVLFNYGKEILYKSCFLTNIIKKVSRAYHTVSEGYPSLSTRIASIHTACHSAANKGTDSVIPYFMAVTEISMLLQLEAGYSPTLKFQLRDKMENLKMKVDIKLLIFMNILGKDFGGLPIMSPLDYIYRGHPDPITSHLCWLKILAEDDILIAKLILLWIISLEGIDDRIDFSALIQDPVALNFKSPTNHVNVIKNNLMTKLKMITKNKDLQSLLLLGKSGEKTKKELTEYLATITECSPRILNEIFRNSPEGARLNFILTFTDMRTLKNLFNNHEQTTLNEKFMNCDLSIIDHSVIVFNKVRTLQFSGLLFNRTGKTIKNFGKIGCSSVLAQDLRNASWGRIITHITTPHPFEQFKLKQLDRSEALLKPDNNSSSNEHISYIYTPPERIYFNQIFLSRGKIDPYEGSTTKEKKSQRLIPLARVNRSIKAAQSLFRLLCWVCSEESNLGRLIKQLILARTDFDFNLLRFVSGVNYGGSIHHRFHDVITKHSSRPNMRINLYSSIYMSSDSMGKFARGLENWTMHYQGIYLLALSMISMGIISTYVENKKRLVFIQSVNCQECCLLLDDKLLDSPCVPPRVKPIKDCKLLFSTKDDIIKDLNWESLNFIKTEYPRSYDPLLKDKRATAIASSILAIGLKSTQPIVITPITFESDIRIMNTISIAAFLQVGIKSILDKFCLLWFYEHLRDFARVSTLYGTSLLQSVKMSLVNVPKTYWAPIKYILLVPEIREQIQRDLGFDINTPLSYMGEDVFNRSLTNYMIKYLTININPKSIYQISLYCVSPGMSFLRNALIWINALVFTTYDGDVKLLETLLYYCHIVCQKSLNANSLDMKSFFVGYITIRQYYNMLPDILENKYTMCVSLIGPEPWCKSRYPDTLSLPLSIKEISSAAPRRVNQTSLSQLRQLLKRDELSRKDLLISRSVLIPESICSVDLNNIYNHQTPPNYEYHKVRQTGIYTTSHYKFLDVILSSLPDHNFQQGVCLADGSGGVSNLLLSIYTPLRLIYNSLVDITLCPSHRLPGMYPPEINTQHYNVVEGVTDSLFYGGDLREEDTSRRIIKSIHPSYLTLLTCDLELGFNIPRKYQTACFHGVMNIFRSLTSGSWVIYKHFINDLPLTYYFINCLLTVSSSVSVIRSSYSNPNGYEVFLVAKLFAKHLHHARSETEDVFPVFSIHPLDYDRLCRYKENLLYNQHVINFDKFEQINNILISSFFYKRNINMSLIMVSNGLINEIINIGNILSQIGESLEILTNLIIKRMISYGKIQSSKRLDKIDLLAHGPHPGENKDLLIIAHSLYSLILLRDYIYNPNLEKIDFEKGFLIKKNGKLVYRYIYNQWEWGKSMSRHFYKVIGYLETIMSQDNSGTTR